MVGIKTKSKDPLPVNFLFVLGLFICRLKHQNGILCRYGFLPVFFKRRDYRGTKIKIPTDSFRNLLELLGL
jgi:hypothetical protein